MRIERKERLKGARRTNARTDGEERRDSGEVRRWKTWRGRQKEKRKG